MTGRYQQRFGHEFNPGPARRPAADMGLPLTETTLPDRLKAAGYATGMVGKWHLGYDDEVPSAEARLRRVLRLPRRGPFLSSTAQADRANAILRGTKPVDEKEYLTDAFGREAVAFIDRHKEHPVLPVSDVQRRTHADARHAEVSGSIRFDSGRAAADLCGHDSRAWTTPSAAC